MRERYKFERGHRYIVSANDVPDTDGSSHGDAYEYVDKRAAPGRVGNADGNEYSRCNKRTDSNQHTGGNEYAGKAGAFGISDADTGGYTDKHAYSDDLGDADSR